MPRAICEPKRVVVESRRLGGWERGIRPDAFVVAQPASGPRDAVWSGPRPKRGDGKRTETHRWA